MDPRYQGLEFFGLGGFPLFVGEWSFLSSSEVFGFTARSRYGLTEHVCIGDEAWTAQ